MIEDFLLFISERIATFKLNKLKKQSSGLKENAVAGSVQAMQTLATEAKIKKMTLSVWLMRFSLGVKVTSTLLIIFLIIIFAIYIMFAFSTLGSVATWVNNGMEGILGDSEDDSSNPGYSEIVRPSVVPNMPNISGGIYPKDDVLKSRAILLEVLQSSADDAEAKTGIYVDPAWILGTMYRESGNNMYRLIDGANLDIWTELIVMNPACAKGTACKWVNDGVSHYVGGKVVNGVDQGDPHTQQLNTSRTIYDKYDFNKSTGTVIDGGHAVGFVQYEIPYIYNSMSRFYPIGNYQTLSQHDMDASLGFIRPNPFYVPDALYNCVYAQALTSYNNIDNCRHGNEILHKSDYANIFSSKDFTSLNKRNQDFIKFMYAAAQYGRGHIHTTEDEMAYELIRIVKEGKIEYLDEMLLPMQDSYFIDSSNMANGAWNKAEEYMYKTYGLKIPVGRTSWMGVYAGCVGRCVYNKLVEKINAAEKTEPAPGTSSPTVTPIDPSTQKPVYTTQGTKFLGYVGSGMFEKVGDYYSNEAGCTIFEQVDATTKYSTFPSKWANNSWGDMPLDSSSGNDMAAAGCGIYSLAFCATNLYGQMYDPAYCRNVLEYAIETEIKNGATITNNGVTRKTTYSDYLPGMLSDFGVTTLGNYLGLGVKTATVSSDAELDSVLKSELQKGNLIVIIVQGNDSNFWYEGSGHFMVVRGYNNSNGLYRGYSSYALGKSQDNTIEAIANREYPASTIRRHLKRNFVWIVGLKENI